jgi:hypothetical protein
VTATVPGEDLAFRTVPERFGPRRADSTTWTDTLAPEGTSTRVTHSYEVTKFPVPPFRWLDARPLPQHLDGHPKMAHTLEALRAELESPTTPAR